nr:reverse transcriptase domain-containing protein [Tanacetum cinerariifolium]
RPPNRRREDEDEESEENPFGDGSSSDEQSVPENKRVLLIATKLRGRASAWWQQMKLTRERVGKSKITSWQNMRKCLRANFIPHNYQQLMYQRLQNLKQGSKSVEDYTTEFYQLITRNDIQEREDQLVSRYIGGLRVQIMDSVNMFDPMTLFNAFQRALAFKKQNRRAGSSSSPAITGVSGSGPRRREGRLEKKIVSAHNRQRYTTAFTTFLATNLLNPGRLVAGIGFPGDMSPGISRTEKLEGDKFSGDIARPT